MGSVAGQEISIIGLPRLPRTVVHLGLSARLSVIIMWIKSYAGRKPAGAIHVSFRRSWTVIRQPVPRYCFASGNTPQPASLMALYTIIHWIQDRLRRICVQSVLSP